jgi:NAD(P)-dependent dehydrogenase (short-subunit alcohol dehydrogenase family)
VAQRLLNKVAVVTGAGGGIGRAIAERFLNEGAKVVVFGRSRGPLEETASVAPARVLVVEGDVTDVAILRNASAMTARRFGPVDIVVANAGFARFAPLVDCETESARDQFETNVLGALGTVQAFAGSLNSGASVLFLTASPSLTTVPGLGIHAATKAALRALVQSLSIELAPRGVRVNCIAPGPTRTALWRPLEKLSAARKTSHSKQADRLPFAEFAKSQDIAEAAVFLSSEAAGHIRGQEFVIDATA